MPQVPSSIYPLSSSATSNSNDRRVVSSLIRIPPEALTSWEKLAIGSTSLLFFGAMVWTPFLYAYAWRKWSQLDQKKDQKKRMIYGSLLVALTGLAVAGPQRSHRFGQWIRLREWKLWNVWLKFLAMEVLRDTKLSAATTTTGSFDPRKDPCIQAFAPHGIMPLSIGLAGIAGRAREAFGNFRMVVASATAFLPLLRDVMLMVNCVDASRPSVDRALSNGDRIGVIPGGIPEIFEGYPKPGTHPDDEYAIVSKGFLRMALKHQIPVVPIYCFGATKLFKRLQLPAFVERISLLLRASIVIFFGMWGLPLPFRQRFLYVMGDPIVPPPLAGIGGSSSDDGVVVEEMQQQFCDELMRLFDNHKESYGWGHKTLNLITR